MSDAKANRELYLLGMENERLVCLQIHNDYQIKGGETKTAELIASLLEKNGIKVIRYYKSNMSFAESSFLSKAVMGIKSIYNQDTVNEVKGILDSNKVDFALIHNTMPIISNSIYKVLVNNRIPIIKYLQNYNMICLNGALDGDKLCSKCQNNNFIGVRNRCYKNSCTYSFIKYLAKNYLDKFYLHKIDAFMPNSKFVKARHTGFALDEQKMFVMYNYISGNRNKYDVERSRYLYFGRISKEKGILTLISAFEKLPELSLRIVGSGEIEDYVAKYVSERQLTNIDIAGPRFGKDLEREIYEAKCVVVPSEWGEPLPRTILEAYYQGTPVIGSDQGGIPEMIIEGQTGFVFKAGREDEIVDKVLRLEKCTQEQYNVIRNNCCSEADNVYSEEAYIARFLDVVNRVIK